MDLFVYRNWDSLVVYGLYFDQYSPEKNKILPTQDFLTHVFSSRPFLEEASLYFSLVALEV